MHSHQQGPGPMGHHMTQMQQAYLASASSTETAVMPPIIKTRNANTSTSAFRLLNFAIANHLPSLMRM